MGWKKGLQTAHWAHRTYGREDLGFTLVLLVFTFQWSIPLLKKMCFGG